MARIRLFLVAAFVLAMVGCPLLEQQENFISFTLDGMQYIFTASADRADHPWAVGYADPGYDPHQYLVSGSATASDALAGTNTLEILLVPDGDWYFTAYYYDSEGYEGGAFLGQVPEGMIDTLIANRDAAGEQFAASMPGPWTFGSTPVHELKDIVFSVERLPNTAQPEE